MVSQWISGLGPLLAFGLLLTTAVLIWRRDPMAAIHLLPRYGVVLIVCLSLSLSLRYVFQRSGETYASGPSTAVAGFVLTAALLAMRLPGAWRGVVCALGGLLVVAVPASQLALGEHRFTDLIGGMIGMIGVVGAGLLAAVPLKLFAPADRATFGVSRP